jgi:hypothetical protein
VFASKQEGIDGGKGGVEYLQDLAHGNRRDFAGSQNSLQSGRFCSSRSVWILRSRILSKVKSWMPR